MLYNNFNVIPGELRWRLFTRKDVQSEALPPTRSSLVPFIQRAHYQVLEWRSACNPHPQLPDPTKFGWEKSTNHHSPVMSLNACAPEWLINLVRCGCKKGRCAVNCKCKSQSLKCTEICNCGGDEDKCDNNDLEIEANDFDSDNDF